MSLVDLFNGKSIGDRDETDIMSVAASGKRNKFLETDIYLMIHTFF